MLISPNCSAKHFPRFCQEICPPHCSPVQTLLTTTSPTGKRAKCELTAAHRRLGELPSPGGMTQRVLAVSDPTWAQTGGHGYRQQVASDPRRLAFDRHRVMASIPMQGEKQG